ncbi:hypothetical protein AD006_30840 (plasmid) [Pseudonocardia sp. EC080610-09]|uniref:hypothetical protein n=1 Tax=unclassified Pseudonocardia TaxID=2619320 RepID=UPI000706CFBB|nr:MULTISPECIES: hypothetical protein [unclassified Pseudonocardia]ALL79600.1 hypothetical protein AD006_30840 [Pseudonocardia sp. EC080610-09]ALL85445.1 hypothetical protein AD017_30395 [Pseudonocardia sp. EC080619-01]
MRLTRSKLIVSVSCALVASGIAVSGAVADPTGNNAVRPLEVNQTEGFAEGQNQVFTYGQNFHCTIEPFDDLDGVAREGDGVPAAADPDEMYVPECIAGETAGGSEPVISPAGIPAEQARRFWAIVPTFDANGNGVPEGLDPTPAVDLQCPEPGPPVTAKRLPFGSCTMHPSAVLIDPIAGEAVRNIVGVPAPDLPGAPGLPGELPVDPPAAVPTVGPGVVVPLPSHSHIAETTEDGQVWWQVIVVLVREQSVWPDRDGNCSAGREKCLTSIDALRSAQAGGETVAGRDIPTNLWLFFANEPEQGPVGADAPVDHHAGMNHG